MDQTSGTTDRGGSALIAHVRARVNEDEEVDIEAGLLVLAALAGDPALERALVADAADHNDPNAPASADADSVPTLTTSAYVQSMEVQGFRGIGTRCTLQIVPGPGLTLIVGRNGSGKSSFAEALELLLTGENRRWAHRSAVWKEGWRNLHWTGPVEIEASLAIEGEQQPLIVRCAWTQDADVADVVTTVRGARRGDGLAVLGWEAAISTYRPFLPYNELGSIPDSKPAELYDMMSAALGLDALVDARGRLRDRRLDREKHCRATESARKTWFPDLEVLDDERARTCARAIKKPSAGVWDLDAVELVLEGAVEQPEGEIALLRELATLREPSVDEVAAAAASLRAAVEADLATAATDAGRAQQLADLLERSLEVHAAHGDRQCPVCGEGSLNDAWRSRAEAQIIGLRQEAATAKQARQSLAAARRSAQDLLSAPPRTLDRADAVGVDAAGLLAAWKRWTGLSADTANDRLIAHLDDAYAGLAAEAVSLRDRAAAALENREDAWRPLARTLRDWLPDARRAVLGSKAVRSLRVAEQWLQAETERLRAQRFRPIAERAAEVWALLRQNSSVALDSLRLDGAATRRRVVLDVSVDGAGGRAALGVMSQGEIHALALSLFLPRVLLPESPFGFVVIDDPVQAMDPGKVDGLARVLNMAARMRQVIVFTHDERLPESIRRLQIPARVLEVTRRSGSVVECRATRDPVAQYLDDARALLRTRDIPPRAAEVAVPLFCRLAVEAACTETVRRRCLGRGQPHADVEDLLVDARTLLQKLALALYDDAGSAGEVFARLSGRSQAAATAVRWANRGPHAAVVVKHLPGHVDEIDKVTQWVRNLR